MNCKTSDVLMAGFIVSVILAGLFGPWGISLVLGLLACACVLCVARTRINWW